MFAPPVAKAQMRTGGSPTRTLTSQRSTLAARPFGVGAADHAHMPQWSIGNQATLRLFSRRGFSPAGKEAGGDHGHEAEPARLTARGTTPGVSWDFSRIPLFPPERASLSRGSSPQPGIIQPRLTIGKVNDPLEHEADRVADQIMGMAAPGVSVSAAPQQLSRKCAACEEETRRLQTMRGEPSEAAIGVAPGIVREALRSSGQPLDAPTRAFLEPRFGRDFSG